MRTRRAVVLVVVTAVAVVSAAAAAVWWQAAGPPGAASPTPTISVPAPVDPARDHPPEPGTGPALVGPELPAISPSSVGEYRPAPGEATQDLPDHYVEGCHQLRPEAEPEFCVYGDPESDVRVVLVGDSHAAHWQPGLRDAAVEEGWRLEVYTKSACLLADQQVWMRRDAEPYATCSAWNEAVVPTILDREPAVVVTSLSGEYDAVVDGQMVPAGPEADVHLVGGLVRTWERLVGSGVPFLVLMDTPWHSVAVGECVEENAGSPEVCDSERDRAVELSARRLIDAAAAEVPGARVVDLTPTMCSDDLCPAVVDEMLVMRDTHHLTATFAASLWPWLAAEVGRELGVRDGEG